MDKSKRSEAPPVAPEENFYGDYSLVDIVGHVTEINRQYNSTAGISRGYEAQFADDGHPWWIDVDVDFSIFYHCQAERDTDYARLQQELTDYPHIRYRFHD